MKPKTFVLTMAGIILCYLIYSFFGPNNGPAVPPNQLALVVSRTSFTQAQAGPDASIAMAPEALVKNSDMEIYHGRRIPLFKAWDPRWYIFPFYLGVQDYEYSGRASYESPDNDSVSISTAGDNITFDINVQLEIDMSIPPEELAIKLFRFIQSEKLTSVQEKNNLLSVWAKQRLKQVVERILRNNLATSQILTTIRGKDTVNEALLKGLNEYVANYGLKFRSAAVTSAMHLPQSLKGNMLNAVRLEYASLANNQRQEQLVPLVTSLQALERDGNQLIQDEENRGESEAMKIVAAQYQDRRDRMVKALGPDHYATYEQMHLLRRQLMSSGRTKVVIAPKGMQVLTGLEQLPQPTAKSIEGDSLIQTTEIDEHGVMDTNQKQKK